MLSLATTFSWLPENLDLLNGMTLGAGVGAALGGALGLFLPSANLERIVVAGTIFGVLGGAGIVAVGNANIPGI